MGETTHRAEILVPEDADSDRAGETVEIEVGEDDYVLAAARDEGLWLPADCQQGWCTTCAAELLEGEVDQSDAKRYYESDEEAGMILPCTAKPRSDLRIRSHQQREMLEHRAENDNPPGKAKLD
ncbi:2Fe-2S iron-sulfur cluster-binding protein [Halalkalicoccus sp. NIPERK01]|uniref:2Fe-2S iron-sulfur cluster-binding protein n=1 Tax=Halalkalicoccus sp. NIPERK01 TaxID=3053469 RepID=UPI00256EB877|nr:2Fe-2S iron-sulfur cluster-binding protein [Halalkalicoccus sp. NIPERK01]MDL5361293.1 2Fe-2S iron-sulfur cluster-binding protein [Halalkalicoccus sp. NIPERK01]